MSKLLLSNSVLLCSNYQEIANEGGYKTSRIQQIGSFQVDTWKKLCVDNVNYYYSEDGYISAVGTFIYSGKTDIEALKLIYRDFNGDILSLRNHILGNYLLLICKGDMCYICTDKNGLFDAFYYNNINDGVIAISNTLYELCKSIPYHLTVNELNVLEQVFQIAILGNETIVDEVKRLRGYEYIIVDIHAKKMTVINALQKPEYSIDNTSDITRHVDEFCSIYENYTKTISEVFNKDIAISATGGLDARMVLSGFLKNNVKPALYSGEGNSVLSTTRQMDTDIVEMIAKEFNNEHKFLNWKTADPVDKYWDKYIQRYGFFAGIYGGSEDTMNSYENVKERFITHGFFGEMYRTVDFIQSYIGKEDSMKLDDYLDKYYIEMRVQGYVSPELFVKYRDNIKRKFIALLDNYGFEYDSLTADMCQALIFEYRRNADSRFVNFCNRQRYSIAIIGEKELIKHTFLPVATKANATFIIRAINKLEPRLLDFPLYSTCKVDYIDKEQLIMKTKNVVGNNYVVSLLRNNMKYKWVQKTYFYLSIIKKRLIGDKKVANEQRHSSGLATQLKTIIVQNKLFEHRIYTSASNDMSRMSRYAIMMLILRRIQIINESSHFN